MPTVVGRIATFLLLAWVYAASAMCPLDCFCGLDERGRRKTSCLQGGLIGPIQVSTIDKSTQVLEVKAPADNPNWLVVGPLFQSLVSLEELRIVRSGLPEIGKHTFWGVKNLELLDLSENNITTLQDHNFRGLANVRELYLHDNRINHLTSGTFKYMTDLRVLSLARNRLEEVMNRVFERLSKLQRLDLSGNRLLELHPEIFMDVQELKVLECRRCGLRNVNTQIYHLLQHLTTLDLGENEFYYIANDEFYDLRKLKILWLDGNHLPVVLEKTFIMQRELQKVSFARNRLAKVTNQAFINVTTLAELDLSYNKFIRLEPAAFQPLAESLQRLDLSGNGIQLTELRTLLQEVANLRHLTLADMNLTDIPVGTFANHERLWSLNLSGNHFTTFPYPVLGPLVELQELDLSRNKFNGLDERTLTRFDTIQKLHLGRNPWTCDLCSMEAMLERVNKSGTMASVMCASPRSVKGRTLASLQDSEMGKCGESSAADSDTLSNMMRENAHVVLIVATSVGATLLLVGSVACVRVCCFKRRSHAYDEEAKREAARPDAVFENATAVFGQNGEISFKFPLELEEKMAAIATIDAGIKKDSAKLPNGDL